MRRGRDSRTILYSESTKQVERERERERQRAPAALNARFPIRTRHAEARHHMCARGDYGREDCAGCEQGWSLTVTGVMDRSHVKSALFALSRTCILSIPERLHTKQTLNFNIFIANQQPENPTKHLPDKIILINCSELKTNFTISNIRICIFDQKACWSLVII